jgi:hypothetical protein
MWKRVSLVCKTPVVSTGWCAKLMPGGQQGLQGWIRLRIRIQMGGEFGWKIQQNFKNDFRQWELCGSHVNKKDYQEYTEGHELCHLLIPTLYANKGRQADNSGASVARGHLVDPLNYFHSKSYELFCLHPSENHLGEEQGLVRNKFKRSWITSPKTDSLHSSNVLFHKRLGPILVNIVFPPT